MVENTKIEKFYIHFEQKDHFLTINEYEQLLKSTKKIFYNISQDIMNIDSDIELVVYAPHKGCILTIFGISLSVGGVVKFLETDMGKAFIKGLTNHEPAYWTEKLGELIKALIIKIYSMTQEELKEFIEEYQKYNEIIMKLDKSRKASSDFYRMCKNNPEIKAIGFSKDNIFPIAKVDFEKHISEDITRDLGTETSYKKLKIIKPVTINNPKDKWTLADTGTIQGHNYVMGDACFQAKVLEGNFVKQGSRDDEIIAEIEYKKELKNGEEIFKDRKVRIVYALNGEKFYNRELPKNIEFDLPKKKILVNETQKQIGLFEGLNNNQEDANA